MTARKKAVTKRINVAALCKRHGLTKGDDGIWRSNGVTKPTVNTPYFFVEAGGNWGWNPLGAAGSAHEFGFLAELPDAIKKYAHIKPVDVAAKHVDKPKVIPPHDVGVMHGGLHRLPTAETVDSGTSGTAPMSERERMERALWTDTFTSEKHKGADGAIEKANAALAAYRAAFKTV